MSMREDRSPDGRYVTTIWSVYCYNVTGYTPEANVRRAGQKRPVVGNLLVGAPGDSVWATWTGTNALLVEYFTDSTYIHWPPASTNIYGVKVTFQRRYSHE
jgi:hypothetical protein